MGQIRGDFGHVSIEARRESFIIHADYGYKPALIAALTDLRESR